MESRKLVIENSKQELEQVQSFIGALALEWSIKPEITFSLNLILEEYISNLVNYGYHDKNDHEISIEISREEARLKLVVIDDAGPFNILETPENEDLDKPVEERKIGGLGIHFIRSLADHLEYKSDNGRNKLTIIKRIIS
jgi:anti-sigma regulatory factor (Ser/Thr protein kinase)